jgi:glycosyltransferase involved in cell wall biosynthesis
MAQTVVLIAGKNPLEFFGGHSSYVRVHARAALRHGFDVHIFCVSPDQSVVIQSELGVVHCVRSPFRPFRQMMVAAHAPRLAVAVERFLAGRSGTHLIHGFGVWACIGVAVSRRLRRERIEAIPLASSYTTYEHEARGKMEGAKHAHFRQRAWYGIQFCWIKLMVEPYERRGYQNSRAVIVNYDHVRRLVLARYGSRVKFRTLPYTCETAFSQRQPQESSTAPISITNSRSEPVHIVAISRHDFRKGINVLLSALAELRMAGVPFHACLVGGGPLLEAHRRLVRKLELADVVIIEGWVSNPEPYLRRADVFVLPSLQEGSGSLSLIEALHAGVAVVASDIDGVPEDVTDGDNALLVEAGNASKLCAALRRVITDDVLREHLARRARETFVEKFSAEVFCRALGELYADLLADHAVVAPAPRLENVIA